MREFSRTRQAGAWILGCFGFVLGLPLGLLVAEAFGWILPGSEVLGAFISPFLFAFIGMVLGAELGSLLDRFWRLIVPNR